MVAGRVPNPLGAFGYTGDQVNWAVEVPFVAAEAITAGQVVNLAGADATTGAVKVDVADAADDVSLVVGVANTPAATGEIVRVVVMGYVQVNEDDAAFVAGSLVTKDASVDGAVEDTTDANAAIGIAVSADDDALHGGTGKVGIWLFPRANADAT